MSYTFGIQQDAENLAGQRGKAMSTRGNVQGGPKRTALGVITNQVNQNVRVQPSRGAKQKVPEVFQDENAYSKKAGKGMVPAGGQFSVFVDQQPVRQSKPAGRQPLKTLGANAVLPSSITAVPKESKLPLAQLPSSPEVIELDLTAESPMVLDVSVEEKKPLDREAVILTVPEYEEDIYQYLRQAEMKHRPKPGYMKRQQDITVSMRSILVDWLVEVSEEYKLHRETLFLAVNYIDRFLSKISVLRGKLQLVGAASMFIASKYEEIYPPDVTEFAYITDDTYTKQQVLRMEHLILKVLSFDVAVPTTNWFCDDFLKSCDANDQLKALTMFLAEMTLIDMDTYLQYIPSVVASASLCLARYSLGMEPWPQALVKKTGYEIGHFVDCLKDLHKGYSTIESHPQQAIVEKYKDAKFSQVSDFTKFPPPHNLTLLNL